MFVAILDLIPVIGSTIGGIVVSLVALTVSLPVALVAIPVAAAVRLLLHEVAIRRLDKS